MPSILLAQSPMCFFFGCSLVACCSQYWSLTQVSITVLYKFPSTTLAQHCAVPQLQSPYWAVHTRNATHNTVTRLDTPTLCSLRCQLALYVTYCTSRMLYSILVGIFPETSVYLIVRKGLAYRQALTSEASRVTALLGAPAFCFSILTGLI